MRQQLSQSALVDVSAFEHAAEETSQLKDKFEKAAINVQNSQAEIEAFFSVRKQLFAIKQMLMKMSLKTAKFDPEQLSRVEQEFLSTYDLLGRFLAPQMKNHLLSKAKQLNLKTVIDQEMVDDVI